MGQFTVAFIALVFLIFSTDALVVQCEGDDLSTSKWLKCEDNHVIQIKSAKYGRADSHMTCQSDANSTRVCGMKDVYDIVSPVCEGKQKCDYFIVNPTNFGEMEQCRNVKKYLLMHIECVKIQEPEDNEPRRPLEESSKRKAMTFVMQSEKARTSGVQFSQHDGSTSNQPVGLFILFVGMLGTFSSLY